MDQQLEARQEVRRHFWPIFQASDLHFFFFLQKNMFLVCVAAIAVLG